MSSVAVDSRERFRLPNGDIVADIEQYANEWNNLAQEVVKHFPGYTVSGFSPCIILERRETFKHKDGSETYITIDRLQLSVMACRSLLYKEVPPRQMREDLYL